PARTLLDLGAVASLTVVESALEDAVHRGLVSPTWLERTLRRCGAPGRDGTADLRLLLDQRGTDAAASEGAVEDEIIRILRRAGLPDPVRQHPVGAVRLDISYPQSRIAVEAQSVMWHANRAGLQRDCDKLNFLVSNGWRVLAFTWHDARQRPWHVAD